MLHAIVLEIVLTGRTSRSSRVCVPSRTRLSKRAKSAFSWRNTYQPCTCSCQNEKHQPCYHHTYLCQLLRGLNHSRPAVSLKAEPCVTTFDHGGQLEKAASTVHNQRRQQ
jgi:hypothetical protein